MRKHRALLTTVMVLSLLGALAGMVWANGTETLGDPDIAIEGGTGIIAEGTGLFTQPGTIDVTVPAGAVIKQVLLYWGDRTDLDDLEGAFIEDDTIVVNGTEVTGVKIGGPSVPLPSSNVASTAYRADITAMGLISSGVTSTLTLEGVDFDGGGRQNDVDGAGVFVIVDDGSGAADIQVRDGSDYANAGLNSGDLILGETVPQVFTIDSSTSPRDASLALHVGDAAPSGRSSQVKISDNGGVIVNLINPFHSTDGGQWDTLTIDFVVPAGATEITVEVISGGPGAGGPASLHWIGAGLAITPAFDPGNPAIDIEKLILTSSGGDNICDDGKPQLLTMLYNGGNTISNTQGGKAKFIVNDLGSESPVRIIASDKDKTFDSKAKVWFDGLVASGDTFDIDAAEAGQSRLKSNTVVHILDLDDNILQSVKFHTSCSQPLNVGDQFGGVQLVAFVLE